MVTNLDMTVGVQRLYDDMYSERDEMKNGIKDQQLVPGCLRACCYPVSCAVGNYSFNCGDR